MLFKICVVFAPLPPNPTVFFVSASKKLLTAIMIGLHKEEKQFQCIIWRV